MQLLLCLCYLSGGVSEACCHSAPGPEQQRTRARVSVSGVHYSGGPSGSAACSTCQHSPIYRARLTDPDLLPLRYKTPDFSHRIGECCHPAPLRDCEADSADRSSVAVRTASSSRKLLPSVPLGMRLGKACIRLASEVMF